MTQKISFQYRDPEDTELMNHRWEGIIEPGVKQGFEVTLGTDPPQTTITIRPGVLVTNDYCRVEETESLIDVCDIPENTSADPRWDLVVCEHRYLRSTPPPVAEYYILQGTPGADPALPDVPENCVPLAYCRIPAGETQYFEIVNFITHLKYNCFWDDAGDTWRIRFGAKMAMLISIMPTAFSALNLSAGTRVFFHPGSVADGDPIVWTRAMELTPDGFTEFVELAQEVIAARGIMASLDARLDVSLGDDGAYKRVGILDQVMDEVEQARGSMGSLDDRIGVSLENDGSYKRVGLLDLVMDEVEGARGSKASVDERLDVSLADDGTLKSDTVDTAQIANDAVTHAKIADGAVWENNLSDLAVSEDKLSGSPSIDSMRAVSTNKVKNGNITSEKIADSGVRNVNLYPGVVTYDKASYFQVSASAYDSTIPGQNEVTIYTTTLVLGNQFKLVLKRARWRFGEDLRLVVDQFTSGTPYQSIGNSGQVDPDHTIISNTTGSQQTYYLKVMAKNVDSLGSDHDLHVYDGFQLELQIEPV